MSSTDEQKKLLRREIRLRKQFLTDEQKEAEAKTVFGLIESLEPFRKASVIMAYWAMDDELPTRGFIEKWCRQKTIILPSVDGTKLRLKEFRGSENLVAGDLFAIPEPEGDDFNHPELIEFIVVPGVAFDRQNNRMGRGKAYYDQLLASLNCYKAGVGFSFQLVEKVPADPHDIPMNIVVTGGVVTAGS